MAGWLWSMLRRIFDPSEREVARHRQRIERINALEPELEQLTDERLAQKTDEFKRRLADGETLDDILEEAFAAVREAAKRTIGQRHFDVQVIGAIVLHQGKIAEMKTGEGKTLTATMPLYLHALTGRGVHLVTTNDYLVKWQSEWMGDIFRFLGLTCGYIQHDMDAPERKEMYACDITYMENSELGFDYLRDNMALHPDHLVLRDLYYAIVDEVDSILVDEARTPLIISGMPEQATKLYETVDAMVTSLREGETEDYTVDEKARTAALTDAGVGRVERTLGITNLAAPESLEIAHHVNASLKARYIFKGDVDYVVKEGEVIIVDEFTGRLQPGRRYSDGLHQAIEAKEGVKVEMERQTVARITYQNFFRMYEILAGMTGTAKTEEPEFLKIYGMPVVIIPTNMPMIRLDHPDVVYKTEEAKFRGITNEIFQCHARGQPALVGTRSVDVSEMLGERLSPDKLQLAAVVMLMQQSLQSKDGLDKETREKYLQTLRTPLAELNIGHIRHMSRDLGVPLKATDPQNIPALAATLDLGEQDDTRLRAALENGIPHNVLNAKYHEQEAQIIAEAGRPGAVTVATNMAGRGVDIVLGGKPEDPSGAFNPEYDDVVAIGGLHILGTERHESRRIDNQLRGRSGRQGDPGSSRFCLSLEDELMRLFGPQRFGALLNAWPEEEAVGAKLVSRQIENAQKKVEIRNFGIRKDVVKYDDVMDTQRKLMYGERRRVLKGEDLSDTIQSMLDQTVAGVLRTHADPQLHPDDWDLDGLYQGLCNAVPGIEERLSREQFNRIPQDELEDELKRVVREASAEREAAIGPELMRDIERSILLRVIDMRFMTHINEMEQLYEYIHLRAYAQTDPFIAYQQEAYSFFESLKQGIAEDVTRLLFVAEVAVEQRERASDIQKSRGGQVGADEGTRKPIRVEKQPGRNAPCPCGSGKKYKKCCMVRETQVASDDGDGDGDSPKPQRKKRRQKR